MIKKIFLLITAILLVSCGSGKSTASKSKYKKRPSTSVAARKPTYKKPVARPKATAVANTHQSSNSIENTEVLQATTRVKVTTEIVLSYINDYKNTAKNNMAQFGIPSSIILAQGILESGAGTGAHLDAGGRHARGASAGGDFGGGPHRPGAARKSRRKPARLPARCNE